MKIKNCFVALLSLGIFFVSLSVNAQTYPTRPIKLVVPFPPGGLIDNMARLVGPRLSAELGQPVVIENKPGVGGNLGAAEVAKAAGDGYTLLMASPPMTISPVLYKSLPYKPEQLTGISMIGRVPNVLVVNPKSGFNQPKDIAAAAKAKPGKLNYASNGNGTSLHLSSELLKSSSGLFITHIPYRGAAAAITALIAGEVDMMFDNLPSAMGQIKAGTIKPLAVTTLKRSKALPSVPTMDESGFKGFDVSAWFGIAAPAGVSADVKARLEAALIKVAAQTDLAATMESQGASVDYMGAGEFNAFMVKDLAKWKKVADYANIKLD
jgi:tripartite-type tricarboxylate transporter receptor subunit TctC